MEPQVRKPAGPDAFRTFNLISTDLRMKGVNMCLRIELRPSMNERKGGKK